MPTAYELGKKGWQPYLKKFHSDYKPLKTQQSEIKEKEELLKQIYKAADLLRKKFNVSKIILFGSLAHGGWFTKTSDIDLAVEGLSHKDYWEAWAMVESVIRDRRVDFIDINDLEESLKRSIQRYGVVL